MDLVANSKELKKLLASDLVTIYKDISILGRLAKKGKLKELKNW